MLSCETREPEGLTIGKKGMSNWVCEEWCGVNRLNNKNGKRINKGCKDPADHFNSVLTG